MVALFLLGLTVPLNVIVRELLGRWRFVPLVDPDRRPPPWPPWPSRCSPPWPRWP
ncbi:MAG: hypothetical protein R2695_20880 [Acidimicrobiales bacterium]